MQVPSLALFPPVILLFPDGRLTSRRWRRVLWVYAALAAFAVAVTVAQAIAAVAGHDIRLGTNGNLTDTFNPPGWLTVPVLISIGAIWLSFVARQVLSWRAAGGERRQQLKWLASGAAIAVFSILLAALLGSSVFTVGLAALPVGIGVGILKYRLYDIDRIISRTLAYAIVTGLLVGVYAGLVLLTIQVFRVHTPVAVAASTLAAAALFNPLRQRVQRAVDRRFNRARYDADQTVATFAARLKTRSTWTRSAMTWPVLCTRPCNPPMYRCGSAAAVTDWSGPSLLRPGRLRRRCYIPQMGLSRGL